MRPPTGEILQNEYRHRVNQVIDYIHKHYGEALTLEKLAQMACMSKYHFHRVFKSIAGEPVGDFIRRVRMKEAFQKLISQMDKSITEIALEAGFSSSQNFSKMFKARAGISPLQMRSEYNWQTFCKKILKIKGKKREDLTSDDAFFYDVYFKNKEDHVDVILSGRTISDVSIRQMPELHVAYVRSIGPERDESAADAEKLFHWWLTKGFTDKDPMFFFLIITGDGTPNEKVIVDACITVHESVTADKWVNIQKVPGGLYAVRKCETENSDSGTAAVIFDLIFNWLIYSSYQLDYRHFYKHYTQTPEQHPQGLEVFDLYLPVKPRFE
jgi:AraC family transcriptional regulator